MTKETHYIPALGVGWLTPLYDPLQCWVTRTWGEAGVHEDRFKRYLVDQAAISPGHRVLDLGCGTATLTILIKQTHPEARVVGLDIDERILAIGRAKAAKYQVDIQLDQGVATQLPYPDESFDRVLSSLVLHHLSTDDKRNTAREVLRVLRPAGSFHVVDFGRPWTAWGRLLGAWMERFEESAANVKGLLPEIFSQAGFSPVDTTTHFDTLVGTLAAYKANKPA